MAFLAPLAAPLAIASAVVGAAGSVMQGMAAASAGRAQQRAYNQAASIRRQQGAINYQQTLREGERFRGSQLAAIAASGVDVGYGSPMELLADTAREVEWRAQNARWEAEVDATNLENRGRLARWEGNVRQSAAYGSAVGSLFRGATATSNYFGSGATATIGTGSHEAFHEVA